MNNGGIKLRKLLIVSPARNYDVLFQSGVNVISGPIFTGKSSIFKLIDYVFGAKTPPGFPELAHCNEVFLEFSISEELITLSRSLKSSTTPISFFHHSIDEIIAENHIPEEVSHKIEVNKESVTSILLQRLGLNETKLKIAPTQDASKTHAFSFRDLLKVFYIDQERFGSSSAFFERDYVRRIKFLQTLEIVLGLHDDRRVLLSRQISDAEAEEGVIERELAANRKFLNEMKIPAIDDLDNRIAKIALEKDSIDQSVLALRTKTADALGVNVKLVRDRDSVVAEINSLRAKQAEIDRSLKNLARLQVQYKRELKQLEFLEESNSLLGVLPVIVCPSCFQKIEVTKDGSNCGVCCRALPPAERETYVNARLRAIKGRIKDLNKYIEQITQEFNVNQDRLEELDLRRKKLNFDIARVSESYALSETQEAVGFERRLAQLEGEKLRFGEWIDLRKRALGDGSRLTTIKDRLIRLRKELDSIDVDQEMQAHS